MRVSHPARRTATGFLVVASLAVAGAGSLIAQAKQADKSDQTQRADAQATIALVDDLAAGKPAPATLPIKWEHQDYIKAQADKTYVPFTIAIEPGALTTTGISLYLRVVKKGADAGPQPPPAKTEKDSKKDKDKPLVSAQSAYPFENLYVIDTPAPAVATQPVRVSRAFAVPPGDYDVYLAVREHGAPAQTGSSTGGATTAAAGATSGAAAPAAPAAPATPAEAGTSGEAPAANAKAGVIKQTISVPDLGNGELTTSSVIVAQKVEVLQTPLAPDRQAENPYTFGQMKITPAVEPKFSKKDELNVVFWIYGAGVDPTTKKPDVNIDFKFYQKSGDKETYFNKTDPQALNAQTLPPQFDLAAGHQLPGSLAVPLTSFPEGDYRLEIELTDKTSSKTIKRDVTFSVTS
jgi:hypothetical protein